MNDKENLYFIALIPDRKLREEINNFKLDFEKRFKSKKALNVYPHITLKAPFKCSVNKHNKLLNWFSCLPMRQQPFNIQLNNFGAFHNKNNPVVFIKPVASAQLNSLQETIITQFISNISDYINKVDLDFNPHVTIAYRDLEPEIFLKAWDEYKYKIYSAIFEVKAFYLLQHDSRKWNLISTFNLPA